MEQSNKPENEEKIQIHISPDLDYVYRDMINIFVGNGDVLFEFGNHHRSLPDHHVRITERIVLSVPNAYDLLQRLNKTLQDAQARLQEQIKAQHQNQ
ncbi:MAG: hypothetical protein SWH61_02365 [Thermodesulfobacteriota bacterium]|nr:hypothetical protein [Thermodesulfobacteriota bacterium]